ncbi:MAG TPA: GNAT family N-acetyltransferase [Pyrinomonadaceae bacterium]|nr:GNAT family N-acetyltransferase [Pyrinomonadaceae bacterium]
MDDIKIRECLTIEELDHCVRLQRDVFRLPDLEISPRRHLVVSRQAGGWTLGAFTAAGRLAGFVHHLIAVRGADELIGYSHMMAIDREYQNQGIGARLKWAQRERALSEGRRFIKWTWDPLQSRNAHFNLNRLGVVVRRYAENFYGTDYGSEPGQKVANGIDSDRLFANWELNSRRVNQLANSGVLDNQAEVKATVEIPADWGTLVKMDVPRARAEQLRVRAEFQKAFAAGLICAGFERSAEYPRYLLYEPKAIAASLEDIQS